MFSISSPRQSEARAERDRVFLVLCVMMRPRLKFRVYSQVIQIAKAQTEEEEKREREDESVFHSIDQ